jgi:hypothetical protein
VIFYSFIVKAPEFYLFIWTQFSETTITIKFIYETVNALESPKLQNAIRGKHNLVLSGRLSAKSTLIRWAAAHRIAVTLVNANFLRSPSQQ